VLRLNGPLTMRTAPEVLQRGRDAVAAGDVVIDFAAIAEADSAALGLLLDWLRAGREAGHQVQVRGLPRGLQSLAELYGIQDLLPLAP